MWLLNLNDDIKVLCYKKQKWIVRFFLGYMHQMTSERMNSKPQINHANKHVFNGCLWNAFFFQIVSINNNEINKLYTATTGSAQNMGCSRSVNWTHPYAVCMKGILTK